jgi:hypothetical protein
MFIWSSHSRIDEPPKALLLVQRKLLSLYQIPRRESSGYQFRSRKSVRIEVRRGVRCSGGLMRLFFYQGQDLIPIFLEAPFERQEEFVKLLAAAWCVMGDAPKHITRHDDV